MPTCPNCGEMVMAGDPYCSHCGTTFRWADDDNSNDHISGLRLKVRHLIRNEEYESALEAVRQLMKYGDASDEMKAVRCHYVKLYAQYAEDLRYGDACDVVDEYLEIFPDDRVFLSLISLKARECRHSDLLDEINYKLDMMDGFEAYVEFH